MIKTPLYDPDFKTLMKLLNVNDYYYRQVSEELVRDGVARIGLVWNSETYRRSPEQWDAINAVVGPTYAAWRDGDAVEILYHPAA